MLVLAAACAALPQSTPTVHGTVADALERPVANATVTAENAQGAVLARARTDAHGRYTLPLPEGAVEVAASAPGLAPASATAASVPSVLVLGLAATTSTINVVAAGVPIPAAQLGNATATITAAQMQASEPLQADQALRSQAGMAVITSGQPGSVASVFMRGAPSDFTKVLLDGVPIQRIDLGGYDFANLAPVGLEQVAIVRGPDSVIYGSDAAAGVIAITTRRGSEVEAPIFDATAVAGAYATVQQTDQLLGNDGRFDYALRYGYTDTHNQQPNSKFRNNSYGANLGWRLSPTTQARFSLQRNFAFDGQPNALLFYGLPDSSYKTQAETYADLSLEQQLTPQFTQQFHLTQAQANLFSIVPNAVGIPDGFGDYDGLPVTIRGANGYSATGQAILDFAGAFPQASPSDTLRRDASWESQLHWASSWSLITGYRYDNERGLSSNVALSRHDNGVYAMLTGGLAHRLFGTLGASADRNTPFGTTANPQGSLAFYPRMQSAGFWNETRLRMSAGTGLKDPGIEDEEFSLYDELQAASGGPALIQSLGITPLAPQRSRNFDAGVDQTLGGGAGTLSLTWFDQRYYDLIEDVPDSAFPLLGIPGAVAAAAPYGGEYNSLTQRARGAELEAHFHLPHGWRTDATYTATDAEVLRSFSFDALAPSYNPNLPGIAIGAFAPLVGARPFRVPPQTASAEGGYTHGRFSGAAQFYWVSRRDDSTFLTDANFGNTLLLPNRNLDPGFSSLNLSGTWQLAPRWQFLAAVDNTLNRAEEEVIGYPGPGITARIGVRFTWTPPLPH